MAGGAARLVGAAGVVAVAAAAHVAGGAELPAPVLLALLVLILTGLAELAPRLPAPVRSMRVRLAAAVVLQPVLHVLFEQADGRAGAGPAVPMTMAATHLVAAVLGAWWLARGANRLVVAVGATVRRVLPSSPMPAPVPAPGRIVLPACMSTSLDTAFLRAVRRRGPPIGRSVHS